MSRLEQKLTRWHRKIRPRALYFDLIKVRSFVRVSKLLEFCRQHSLPIPVLRLKRNEQGNFNICSVDDIHDNFQYFEWALFSCIRSISYNVTTTMPHDLKMPSEFCDQSDSSRAALYFNHDEHAPVVVFRPPNRFASFRTAKAFSTWLTEGVPCKYIVFALTCLHPSLHYDEFLAPLRLKKEIVDVVFDVIASRASCIGHGSDHGLELMVGVHLGYTLRFASPECKAYYILLLHDHFVVE